MRTLSAVLPLAVLCGALCAADDYGELVLENGGDGYYDDGEYEDVATVDVKADGSSNVDGAARLHEEALELANAGDIEGAMPIFKRAAELNPTMDSYWSNYGVTQMRLNMLDEALVSYTKGLRINPESALIMENMKALREHMSFRQGQSASGGDENDNDDEYDDDEYDDEYEEEVEMEKPAPKRRAKQQQQQSAKPARRGRKGKSGPAPASEVDEWFGAWWQERDELIPTFRDALVNFRPIVIRNFLKPEVALALHSEIYDSSSWEVYEAYHRWYQFHFKAIYQHSRHYKEHEYLSGLSNIMDFPIVKEWVRDISESEVNGTTLAGASYYAAGDYTMPHTDRAGGGEGEKEKRRIAYILHLTKEWNPKFGGDMVWMNPAYHIHPTFNSITLFAVSESSWHFVSPVASITPEHIKRLAFSGWWTTQNIRQAKRIEAQKNDDKRFGKFATVVDGRSGRSIPHPESYERLDGLWPKLLQ